MISKIKIKLAAVTLLALLLVGILGTGIAAAGSGGGSVGGGTWWWENFPGIYAGSHYYHSSVLHSATAKVGSSSQKTYADPGYWANAEKIGIGTTYVYWNTY
ncbi:MAG: lactococcin 972 family bacteriocin [Actinomycetota bacterium]